MLQLVGTGVRQSISEQRAWKEQHKMQLERRLVGGRTVHALRDGFCKRECRTRLSEDVSTLRSSYGVAQCR